jgi:hypothetical protein
VGHYGIFNGARFRREIAPRIAAFVRANDPRTVAGAGMPALDRVTAVARANGHMHEFATAALAFSFSAANDEGRNDASTEQEAASATQSVDAHQASIGLANIAGVACLNLWQFAGSLFLGGLSRRPQRSDSSPSS